MWRYFASLCDMLGAYEEAEWAHLRQGIDSTLNIVAHEIKYNAEVVKEYGEIPEIECLSSQINQVVLNWVVNAAHAIRPGHGKITLRTGVDGEHVWFSVADTSGGISPDNLKRIFAPVFTAKPIGKGAGLGLSVIYGIVQKHGGRIAVDSEVGRDSTFRVVLPMMHRAGDDAIPNDQTVSAQI